MKNFLVNSFVLTKMNWHKLWIRWYDVTAFDLDSYYPPYPESLLPFSSYSFCNRIKKEETIGKEIEEIKTLKIKINNI